MQSILHFFDISLRFRDISYLALEKNSEIFTMEFAIASLNPYYFRTISIVLKLQLVLKLDFHTIFIYDPYYFHSKDFENNFQCLITRSTDIRTSL